MSYSISARFHMMVVIAGLISASRSFDLPDLPPPAAPTLITECPLYHIIDPESPDGPCICDMDLCPSPDCLPSETPIAVPSSTSCCPMYQCVLCSDEDLEMKNCHCATMPDMISKVNNSYVDKHGGCECIEEEQSWDWFKGCDCDVGKCRLPDLCLGNSVEVRVLEECCERVECVECPDDSVAQVVYASQVEAKCVCRACPEKVCSENEVTVIRKPGRNVPNHCCDLYDCIERGCSINGTKYDEGEQWTIEKDTQCRCQNGIALCNRLFKPQEQDELRNCFYNGNWYRDGDVWTVDQCTNCTCHSGQSKCIAHLCMENNETVVPNPSTCSPVNCPLLCIEYDLDAQGCHICKCNVLVNENDHLDGNKEDTEEKMDIIRTIIIIVAVISAVFLLTALIFFIRRKCKRMRYYPETKHNLLLENNNTSRDIYALSTKSEDQIILPLYRPTTTEIT